MTGGRERAFRRRPGTCSLFHFFLSVLFAQDRSAKGWQRDGNVMAMARLFVWEGALSSRKDTSRHPWLFLAHAEGQGVQNAFGCSRARRCKRRIQVAGELSNIDDALQHETSMPQRKRPKGNGEESETERERAFRRRRRVCSLFL